MTFAQFIAEIDNSQARNARMILDDWRGYFPLLVKST